MVGVPRASCARGSVHSSGFLDTLICVMNRLPMVGCLVLVLVQGCASLNAGARFGNPNSGYNSLRIYNDGDVDWTNVTVTIDRGGLLSRHIEYSFDVIPARSERYINVQHIPYGQITLTIQCDQGSWSSDY